MTTSKEDYTQRMEDGKKMTEEEIREQLVLWIAFHSKITDFRTRAFAIEICKKYSVEKGGTISGIHDFSNTFDISAGSVRKYTTALIRSGEWHINPLQGKPTLYKPRFVI